MTSKIEKELSDLLDINPKRGEDRQDFLKRIVVGINDASDKDYEKISQEALDWFNAAGDKLEAGKDAPDFPDLPKDEPEASSSRRRRGATSDKDEGGSKGPYEPKKGDTVLVVTKRDKKYTGVVVEVDDELLVVKGDDGEEEFQRTRLASVSLVAAGKSSRAEAKDDEPEDPVKVGNEVEVVTKRDKKYTGKIVEIDGDLIVLKTADGEEEFQKDRLATIKLLSGKKDDAPRSRRGSSDKEADKDEGTKTKRGAAGGTSRLRDIMVEHLSKKGKMITQDDLSAAAKKEDLDVKDNTLTLTHSAFANIVELLEKADLLNLK